MDEDDGGWLWTEALRLIDSHYFSIAISNNALNDDSVVKMAFHLQ
jgi:hypothetical protein